MRLLPLSADDLSWQKFESFCLAVIRAMPEVKRADKYGQQGEKQRGIDIEAELVDGRRRTAQCRQRKTFTPASLKKTLRENTFEADEHEIWIACGTSAAVSDAVAKLPKWSIRDREGLSQLGRELPREHAQRILDDHFGPHVRRAFLGPEGPIAFAIPADYFVALDDSSRVLRHDLDLVGRVHELAELLDGVRTRRVVILPGRGGIGKTRLLRAGADALTTAGERVLFAADGVVLNADLVDFLPRERHVVFVDDAHRRVEDVSILLGAARSQQPGPTLVLAVRPGAMRLIDDTLGRAQIESQEVMVLKGLEPLGGEAVRALASQALGREDVAARRLAEATGQLPLLTVLGGRLLGAGELADAAALDAEIRRRTMARFTQEQFGRVTERVPSEQAKELATIVAALAPMNVASPSVIDATAGQLEVTASRVRSWLGELEAAGVLLARGRLRRVVPEILGEQLLEDMCLDPQGNPTGYAEELWKRYGGLTAGALLTNIAALDWRVAGSRGTVLDGIWRTIEIGFRNGDAFQREQLIDTLRDAAIYQPERILRLCELALNRPSRPSDFGFGVQVDDGSVHAKLPVLLRAVGAHAEYATRAMELLWELGRDDDRKLSGDPEHAIRVIGELAEPGRGSRAHQEQLIALVGRRLKEEHVDEHYWSPLQLLKPLLAREGISVRSVGYEFQWGSYGVMPDAVAATRDRVRALLTREALGTSARRRPIATRLLGDALRPSSPSFGRSVPRDVHDAWEPDEHATLDAIEMLSAQSTDPFVRFELDQALKWLAEGRGPWPKVSERAAAISGGLVDEETELVSAIADPWFLLTPEEQSAWLGGIADGVLGRYRDGGSMIAAIDAIYARLLSADVSSRAEPALIVGMIAERSPRRAREAWNWILEHPDAPIAEVAPVLLSALRRPGEDGLREQCEIALDSGHPVMRRVVSGFLAGGSWFAEPEGWEEPALTRQLADEDPSAQHEAAVGVLRLGKQHPGMALRLVLGATSTHPRTTEMLFGALRELDVTTIGVEQISQVMDMIVKVENLDWAGQTLLVNLGATRPDQVIDVLIERLRRHASDETGRYEAIPYHEAQGDLLGGLEGEDRARAMGRLLEEGRDLEGMGRRDLGKLFWSLTVAGLGFDDTDDEILSSQSDMIDCGLSVLASTAMSKAPPIALLEDVLTEMPWQLALARLDALGGLLGAVQSKSPTTAEAVRRGIYDSVVNSGLHGRTMGEESPRVHNAREAAIASRDSAPSRSLSRELFSDIIEWAKQTAAEDRQEDEESGWR
jgi:hypothetical protein